MRIHSDTSKNPGTDYSRQPWAIGTPADGVEDLVRTFVEREIPTLVSAAARVTDGDGMPLVRRLDLEWPAEANATRVAPTTSSSRPSTRSQTAARTPAGGTAAARCGCRRPTVGSTRSAARSTPATRR